MKRWLCVLMAILVLFGLFYGLKGREARYQFRKNDFRSAAYLEPGVLKYQLELGTKFSLTKALEIKRGDKSLLKKRAILRYESKDYAGAAHDYVMVLNGQPENAEVRANLAWCYFQCGKIEEALRNINVAMKRRPDDISFLVERAWMEAQAHKTDLAATDLSRLLSLPPETLVKDYEPGYCDYYSGEGIELSYWRSTLLEAYYVSGNYQTAYDLLHREAEAWASSGESCMDPLTLQVAMSECQRRLGDREAAFATVNKLLHTLTSGRVDESNASQFVCAPGDWAISQGTDRSDANVYGPSQPQPVTAAVVGDSIVSQAHLEKALLFAEAGMTSYAKIELGLADSFERDAFSRELGAIGLSLSWTQDLLEKGGVGISSWHGNTSQGPMTFHVQY